MASGIYRINYFNEVAIRTFTHELLRAIRMVTYNIVDGTYRQLHDYYGYLAGINLTNLLLVHI